MRGMHAASRVFTLALLAASAAGGIAAAEPDSSRLQSHQAIIPTPAAPESGQWSHQDEVWLHRDRLHEGSYYVRSTRYRFGADGQWHLIQDELERHASMPPGCERTPCLPAGD